MSIDGFEDVAGNRMAAHVSQFTTGAGADTVQPSVIATNVTAYGVNNVPINSIFQITFDEPMDAATVLSQARRSSTTMASATTSRAARR